LNIGFFGLFRKIAVSTVFMTIEIGKRVHSNDQKQNFPAEPVLFSISAVYKKGRHSKFAV